MLNRSLIDVERKSIQSVVKLRQLVAAFCRAGVRAPNRDVCSLAVTMNRSAGQAVARARAAESRKSNGKGERSLMPSEDEKDTRETWKSGPSGPRRG